VAALWVLAPLLRLGAGSRHRLPATLRRLGPLLNAAADEVARTERARTLLPALGLSLLLRLTKYGAYYCLLTALLASQDQSGLRLGFLQVFLSVAGAEMAASLPLPTVMSVGPYEAAGAAGFAYWLGLSPELATLAVTAFHGLSQIHDYGLGLLALVWIMASRPRRPAAEGSDPRAPEGRRGWSVRIRGGPMRGGIESSCEGGVRGRRPDRRVMRDTEVSGGAATDSEVGGRSRASSTSPAWVDYLRPLRFDHWIKNLVVPVGSLLALAAQGSLPNAAHLVAILLAFVVSGLVSSVNYAVNEVLDAPFDARHPTKRDRPIRPAGCAWRRSSGSPPAWRFSRSGSPGGSCRRPCSSGRAPCSSRGSSTTCRRSGSRTGRTSTRPPSPSRIPSGSRLAGTPWRRSAPPLLLLVTVWAFGAFLMTGSGWPSCGCSGTSPRATARRSGRTPSRACAWSS
jgi:hypothetical protein